MIIYLNKFAKELTDTDLNNSYFYDINNGITLCKKYHKDYRKINGRK